MWYGSRVFAVKINGVTKIEGFSRRRGEPATLHVSSGKTRVENLKAVLAVGAAM